MRARVIFGLLCGGAGALAGCSAPERQQDETAAKSSSRQEASLAVGPEIGTDEPVPVQENTGFSPDVASDGTGFLAVFEDSSDIRAVRVDAAGKALDMPWINLEDPGAGESVTASQASVAFGGGRYLVTWTQFDGTDTLSVQGRLLRPNGELEGTRSFRISTGQTAYEPSVAWNGENFVVAWTSGAENLVSDIRVTLVGSDGTVVPDSEHVVSTSTKGVSAVVAAGTNTTLVAWQDQQSGVGLVHAARVERDGTVLDPGGVRLSDATTTEDELEVASSGTSFLVAWRKEGTPSVIRGSVVSDAGAVTAKDFAVSHSTVETGSPSVGFDGTQYLVTWADDRDERAVYGTTVTTAGAVAASDQKLADGSPWQLLNNNTSLARSGSAFLVAFHGTGIEGSLIGGDLALIDASVALSPLPNKQGSPSVVWNGQNYLVSWVDEREPTYQDYSARAVRIDTRGMVLDPDGISLSGEETAFSHDTASNAQGATVVVWSNTDAEAWQRSIESDATLSPLASIAASGQSTSPAIATNGDGYLVVFTDSSTSSTSSISGRLLDASGTADAPFVIEPAAQIDFADALSVGKDYLVRYRKAGTWLVPVSGTGVIGERLQLSSSIAHVSTATNGTHALVVWTDISDNQVRGRLYTAGAWQDEGFVVSTTSAGWGAAVAWDGTTYWVVWENDPDTHVLYARSVSGDGEQTPARVLVDEECMAPALASDGEGQMLLSYYQYSESSRVRRVASRLLGKVPPSDAEGGAGGSGGAGDAPETGAAGEPSGGTASSAGGPAMAAGRAGATSGGASGGSATTGGSNDGTAGAAAGTAGNGGDVVPEGCSVSRGGSARAPATGLAFAWLMALGLVRLSQRAAGRRATRAGSRSLQSS